MQRVKRNHVDSKNENIQYRCYKSSFVTANTAYTVLQMLSSYCTRVPTTIIITDPKLNEPPIRGPPHMFRFIPEVLNQKNNLPDHVFQTRKRRLIYWLP